MSENEKKQTNDEEQKASDELDAEALESVTGGIGLLLPAVQKVREAAATEDEVPMEEFSLNYTR